jgi:hypothetical protein
VVLHSGVTVVFQDLEDARGQLGGEVRPSHRLCVCACVYDDGHGHDGDGDDR